jgi:hypothetical protein
MDAMGRHRTADEAPAPRRGGILSTGAAVAVAGVVVNALGYVVLFVGARRLSPGDLSMLASVLGLGAVAGVAGLGLQTAVAVKWARNGPLPGLGRVTTVTTAVTIAAMAVASPVIGRLLHMPVAVPVLTGVTIGAVVVGSRYLGELQGAERFGALAAGLVIAALGRYAGVIVGLALHAGVINSLAVGAVVSWVSLPALVAVARRRQPSHMDNQARPLHAREIIAAAAATMATVAIPYADLVLSRSLLSAGDSGVYAVGAVLTKGALWAPQAITVLVLPKLAQGSRTALRIALLLVAACGVVLVGAATVAGGLAMHVAGGKDYTFAGPYAGRFAAIGAIYAIAFVLVNAEIAGRVRHPGLPLWGALVVLAIAASLVPHTVGGVVGAAVGTAALTTAVMLLRAWRRRPADTTEVTALAGAPYVYLSHAHDDPSAPYLTSLATFLSGDSVAVWFDRSQLTPARWTEVSAPHIDACAAMLVVVDEHARSSEWVRRDILRAEAADRPILVLHRGGRLPGLIADLPTEAVPDGAMPSAEFVAGLRALFPAVPRPRPAVDRTPAATVSARLQHLCAGHSGPVQTLSWSPDGARLATLGADHLGLIWDVHSGARLALLRGHSQAISDGGFAPDGTAVATAGLDGEVRLWDPLTGACRAVLSGPGEPKLVLVWSPDGSRLAGLGPQSIHLYDAQAGASVEELGGPHDLVAGAAWSPDGTLLATANLGVTVWSTLGQPAAELTGHVEQVTWVAWSADGLLVASGGEDQTVRVWDPATGANLWTRPANVACGQWSPDSRLLATGGADGAVRLFGPGRPLAFAGHTAAVQALAWSPDGSLLATASDDHTVRLWDISAAACVHILAAHTAPVQAVAWSPDGRLLATGSHDATARVWELARS